MLGVTVHCHEITASDTKHTMGVFRHQKESVREHLEHRLLRFGFSLRSFPRFTAQHLRTRVSLLTSGLEFEDYLQKVLPRAKL